MNLDECFLLGYVIKRHGLKGEVTVFLDVDDPSEYIELESVFVHLNGKLVPFFVDKISIKGDRAVLCFEDVNSLEQAEELKGKELYLPLSFLPKLEGTAFYYHEIIGFKVNDLTSGDIGVVQDVYTGSGQELLAVMNKNKEVLIPVADQTILEVNRTEQTIKVSLPEGLLDIYED